MLSIGTNTGAIMAQAATSSVTRDMETAMHRLSTGKRINAAADDAAGVAISSRLDSTVRGLNQSIRNALDAQALIDTAEGAMQEIETILQRIRELSIQAANDTNSADDRANLNAEAQSLLTEIDRISSSTTWAGQSLLDGTFTDKSFQVGTGTMAADQLVTSIAGTSAVDLGLSNSSTGEDSQYTISLQVETKGFKVFGAEANDGSGWSVGGSGDINGDGLDDVIIGAPSAIRFPQNVGGQAYVVFGKSNLSKLDLSELEIPNPSGGFSITASSLNQRLGSSVSNAGDVNGDGLDDIIVGAQTPASGTFFVIFGKGESSNVTVSELGSTDDTLGFTINGIRGGGYTVSGGGDINGDGLDDLIVTDAGDTYVIFGKTDASEIELDQVKNGLGGGFVIKQTFVTNMFGMTSGTSGGKISMAGDVNGDGLDDIIISAKGEDNNGTFSGASFVVFGQTSNTEIDLADVALSNNNSGFVINGSGYMDKFGTAVSGAGDVNGDGLSDLVVGAPRAGYAAVIFGKAGGEKVEVSELENNANNLGYLINGEISQAVGTSVSEAGDVNGDGLDDIIVAASRFNGSYDAASFVAFGKKDVEALQISELILENNDKGFAITGLRGPVVSEAGDVNGDGLDDVVIGDYGLDYDVTPGGTSAVIFGKKDGSSVDISDLQQPPLSDNTIFKIHGKSLAVDLSSYYIGGSNDYFGAAEELALAINNNAELKLLKYNAQPASLDQVYAGTHLAGDVIITRKVSFIGALDGALQTLNSERASLGAISNRLDHIVANNTNAATNVSKSLGRIQDADFAAESTSLAKNQILQQASTAMLAQANASKQNILELLQG